MIFICLAAILSAGLQCLGRFALAASTPVLLNLAMIGALGAAHVFEAAERATVYWLCGGVLVGGFLQMALPGADLIRQGWRPELSRQASAALGRLWGLFLPGLLGAAILQVNILVSRLLAYSLDASSVSVLYLASRLMELPLGIFTIAVVTVYFPLLSRMAGEGDAHGFRRNFAEGIQLIIAVTIPAGIGLAVLAQPILSLLFQWGAFEARDVAATLPLLIIYGFGLPAYSIATFATRGLHASQDMVTPVRIAAVCLVTNAALGLGLMQFFGAAGLALGNVLSALLQAVLLWRAISRSELDLSGLRLSRSIIQVCLSGLIMGLLCWIGANWISVWTHPGKGRHLLSLVLLIPVAGVVFFGVLNLLKYEAMETLKQILLDRFRSRR
jgi:putative peptidoglycan lipid II flippase